MYNNRSTFLFQFVLACAFTYTGGELSPICVVVNAHYNANGERVPKRMRYLPMRWNFMKECVFDSFAGKGNSHAQCGAPFPRLLLMGMKKVSYCFCSTIVCGMYCGGVKRAWRRMMWQEKLMKRNNLVTEVMDQSRCAVKWERLGNICACGACQNIRCTCGK